VPQKGTTKPKVQYAHTSALLDQIVFNKSPFLRACMQCKTKGDSGTSFVYLKDSVPVSTGASVLMFFIVFFMALVGWGLALYFDPLAYIRGRGRPSASSQFSYGR
jgi:hypothetical protein